MNFRQILLVLKRDYLTRVRSKAFILTTVLVPLGIAALFAVMIAIMLWDTESDHKIGVIDRTERLYASLAELNEKRYLDYSRISEDSARTLVQNETIEGYVILTPGNIALREPETEIQFVYSGSGGISLLTGIRNDLREVIREERLRQADVNEEVRNIYETRIELGARKLTKEGKETEDDTGALTFVGILMGVIIFGALFGYGGLLTRSVIEEKTSRIVEVIASSVKPIELLLGKMLGVGALGLTQIGIWIAAMLGLSAAATPIAGMLMDSQMQANPAMAGEAAAAMDSPLMNIPTIEASLIIWFAVFFLLGYLIYSSLFAAIGSAVDSETDTQQFMLPIMMPIMIAYFLMFRVTEAPDTSLAVISSIIPFFSPILMITRIAITEVPLWQIWSSILLMILTFMGTMWLSAKIYQVGILSYGKSASFKELMKWIRQG